MSDFVFPPAPRPSLPVRGTNARFPIRRVFCIGRNYAAHAREMGHAPETPFFFAKPADAVVPCRADIPYPPLTQALHHEVELVIAIGQAGTDVSEGVALSLVWGYAVGVDLTRRDLQDLAKSKGRPWDEAKGFDHSAPCGEIVPAHEAGTPDAIWLEVNRERRQSGRIGDMISPIPALLATISRSMRLCPGDLVFTGTPSGVGPLLPGDSVRAGVDGVGVIEFAIRSAAPSPA